jgi:GT2 family glycosyltransferase
MREIAVLITCHNRKEKTIACLESLFKCDLPTGYSLTVFLVDDGSTDGTADKVAADFPDVQLIRGSGTLYWNRGMYLAWKTAASKYPFDFYLWLNDDSVLFTSALVELLSCDELTNGKTLVCGAFSSTKTGKFTYGGRTLKGLVVLPNGLVQSCSVINGNCVLVNKTIFDVVGFLDPIYPHAIGDHDYGLRVLKNGLGAVTTRVYIGYCEENAFLPKWCYNETPFIERVRALYSPLGYSHPYYFFRFENTHYGLLTAIKHFLTIHIRLLLPSLWI